MTDQEREAAASDGPNPEPTAGDEVVGDDGTAADDAALEAALEDEADDGLDLSAPPSPIHETVGAPPPSRRPGRGERIAARPVPQVAPSPSEVAVHIDDRISQGFVILAVAIFAVIFFQALLFGDGGTFTGVPTPSPSASAGASPSASASASPSGSASASPSASVSVAPSASASAFASPSASASVAPSASAASPSP